MSRLFPGDCIMDGTGYLFWSRAMFRAYSRAREDEYASAYLLFNDDVRVDPEAIKLFIDHYSELNQSAPTILVGATQSTDRTSWTYSGYRWRGKCRPLHFDFVEPGRMPAPVDACNGNFVLAPAKEFDRIGGIDPKFRHSLGDLDIGLVAQKSGIAVRLAPGAVGVCDRNTPLPERLSRMSIRGRLTTVFGAQNSPIYEAYFAWKHGIRCLMPLYVAWYVARRLSAVARPGVRTEEGTPDR